MFLVGDGDNQPQKQHGGRVAGLQQKWVQTKTSPSHHQKSSMGSNPLLLCYLHLCCSQTYYQLSCMSISFKYHIITLDSVETYSVISLLVLRTCFQKDKTKNDENHLCLVLSQHQYSACNFQPFNIFFKSQFSDLNMTLGIISLKRYSVFPPLSYGT